MVRPTEIQSSTRRSHSITTEFNAERDGQGSPENREVNAPFAFKSG
jgi:hypothetical protein